eukprot:TRINITY_DN8288_c0_g1_i1.p1 TRINITY_DN8288_c0_g1~~TRINITY_DN8288_c0_g1_i1.p1  ORF type:complete len:359 (+),score=70.43 TRINITY_DN8288_c0_g1_i1:43-1119(+)
MASLRVRDIDELQALCKSHNKDYMVYEQNVLDVTNFKHPGAQSLITKNVGKDVTKLFDDRGHSSYAKELCERLTVGYFGDQREAGKLLKKSFGTMSKEEEEIHVRLDEIIDLKKPLLPQVKKLTTKEFMAFVRRPRFVDDIDGIILHEHGDEESKRPFRHNLMVGIPVASLLTYTACALCETWSRFLLNIFIYYFGLGMAVAWVLVEYVFHRFLLHQELQLDPDAPADPGRQAAIFSQHLHHHVFMNQYYRTTIQVRSYAQYGVPIFALSLCILPTPGGLLLTAGVVTGAMLYDAMHLAFHHGPDIRFSWFQKMKAAHMRHHFRDNFHEFGVTSPLFDHVFGTTRSDVGKPSAASKKD